MDIIDNQSMKDAAIESVEKGHNEAFRTIPTSDTDNTTTTYTRALSDSCCYYQNNRQPNRQLKRQRSVHFIDGADTETSPPSSLGSLVTKVYTRPYLTELQARTLFYSGKEISRFGKLARANDLLPLCHKMIVVDDYDFRRKGLLALYLLIGIYNLRSIFSLVGSYYNG